MLLCYFVIIVFVITVMATLMFGYVFFCKQHQTIIIIIFTTIIITSKITIISTIISTAICNPLQ